MSGHDITSALVSPVRHIHRACSQHHLDFAVCIELLGDLS